MAKDGGMKDKITKAGKSALSTAAGAPKLAAKTAAEKAKETSKGLKLEAKDAYNKSIGAVENRAKKVVGGVKEAIHDPKGAAIKGAKGIGRGAANKAKEFAKQQQTIKKIIDTVTKVANFIATYAEPIAIISGIVLLLSNLIIFGISVGQSVGPTPHYYCEIDASKAIQNSTVYQQYCKRSDMAWDVKNINGHYIVQDGKGPAASCAMANMLLRFYSLDTSGLVFGDTNVYEYLWQADGKYTARGNALGDSGHSRSSLRNILNNYNNTNPTRFACSYSTDMPNGSRDFAAEHGYKYLGSNWGYLRDETLDIKTYMQKGDTYDNNEENSKWVWDMSMDDGSSNAPAGSYWKWADITDQSSWNISFRMNVTKFNVEQMTCPIGDEGYALLKKRLDEVLNKSAGQWTEYYKGSAGVMMQYTKSGNGEDVMHTILITKHTGGMWYGVDSSLGTAGGYEGPLDGTGRFVADDKALATLLNSDSQTISYGGCSYTLNRIGYCTKPKFGFY